jgi:TonB family protein
VYLALPGEGGGGGGGGLKQQAPPPKAERKGTAHIDSPVPTPPPPPAPEPPKAEPPPPPEPVKAPVAEVAASPETRDGQIAPAPPVDSRGSGDQGGVGTGAGTGIGEGKGPGIGEGEGGGTGGGPFRPGSGIEPPSIRREVKPDYTEEARRRNLRGDVLMEIVVKRDGSVGDVHVLRGLGYGLDERAVEAVKQWSFNPATRKGVPVDVLVEVAMEFRLR